MVWEAAMRDNESKVQRKHELPLEGDSTGVFLKVMISIAVFIFALTLAGVLSINSMLQNWNNSILGSFTVQIIPSTESNHAKAVAETIENQNKTIEFLKKHEAVDVVTPLNDAQLQKLIKPWLGDGVDLAKLPIPRLIDVKLKPDAELNYRKLAEQLAEVSPAASLDNHKLWLNKLIHFADGLKMVAMTILILVLLVNSGAIFYSTQTSLGLHKYIIEILHLMGAKDTYIAQQYARRTGWIGLIGGVIGIILAIPAIFLLGNLASEIEGGIISEANLSVMAWGIIFSLPLFAGAVAMLTAYYTVKRTLEKMI